MHKDHVGDIIEQECQTFSVIALSGWTNHPVRIEHDVPPEGVQILAEQMLFEAWDSPNGPETRTVVAVPTEWEYMELCDLEHEAERQASMYYGFPQEYYTYAGTEDELAESDNPTLALYGRVAVANPNYDDELSQYYRRVAEYVEKHRGSRRISWVDKDGKTQWRRSTMSELSRMLRYAHRVDMYVAQPDGAPTPIMTTPPRDPIAPPDHKVLGPYE